MSFKSLLQILILGIILIIFGSVYFKYFSSEKIAFNESLKTNEQISSEDSQKIKDDDLVGLEKEKVLSENINGSKKKVTDKKNEATLKKKTDELSNIVKDVEYLTTDVNGNKYKILATSGRTNKLNKNVLNLDNVRGEIKSEGKSTIYVFSDFAEYNSSTFESKFFNNVIVNFENKQITSENLDINMDTNVAVAYNNVIVKDPKSIMKAGKITLYIETKEISINSDDLKKIKINTQQ